MVQIRIDSPTVRANGGDEMDANEGDEDNNEIDDSIPDHEIINNYGFSDEVEGISVGVFHEIKGPMLHPHKVESARRGIIDAHRLGIEDVRLRLTASDSGYVFWRYKAWILVAERSELLVRERDLVLYQSGLHMADKIGIPSSMEDVEEVQEWIGLSILSQFSEGRDEMLISIQDGILQEVANQKGFDFEDVAIGGGGHPTNQWYHSISSGRIGRSCYERKAYG
jgi:hypothetical protein